MNRLKKASTKECRDAISSLGKEFAKIAAIHEITIPEIMEAIKIGMANHYYDNNKLITNTELALRTGLDKRSVGKYVGKELALDTPKLTLVVDYVRSHLKNNNKKFIPIRNGVPSIKSIVAKLFGPTEDYRDVIKSITKVGCWKEDGKGNIVFLNPDVVIKDRVAFIEAAGRVNKDLGFTLAHNYTNGWTHAQRRIESTQVAPEDFVEVMDFMNAKVRVFIGEMHDYFDKIESPVVPGTYPAIGINTFAFVHTEMKYTEEEK